MRINHNVPAIITHGALEANSRALSRDLEKMSTGLRINRANDDAAGLAVSEGLRTQIRGVEQAKRNAFDGISALSIAEGAMNELHNILQRQRELCVQAANAIYSPVERGYLNQEFKQLSDEIERIVQVTNFNKILLLATGAAAGESVFVGSNGDFLQVDANYATNVDTITVKYASVDVNSGISNGFDSQTAAHFMIKTVDDIIKTISTSRANIGAYVNRLESTVNNLTVSSSNQMAAESQLRDVDFAYQSTQFTKNQILQQSATAMLSQANTSPQVVLSLLR
jgi:flagellin